MALLNVSPPSDGGRAMEDALDQLDNFDWVLFTSTNAVDGFVGHFDGMWPERPRIGTVGQTTTKLLENSGFVVHFTSDESTASALAAEVPLAEGDRVLALLGDRAAPTLEAGLVERGAAVKRVEAYRTLWTDPTPASVAAAAEADYVFLTSPAIAERFSHITQVRPKAVCIGPTTASAATEAGFDVVAVATKRSPDGLIAALVNTIG
jgi:uroporphyrinogen-III synthase